MFGYFSYLKSWIPFRSRFASADKTGSSISIIDHTELSNFLSHHNLHLCDLLYHFFCIFLTLSIDPVSDGFTIKLLIQLYESLN
jgi:hypothetical protein